jgi:hypothetical protein
MALQPKNQPDRIYLVANTHLNFNDGKGDIKLAELKTMTDALAQLKTFYQDMKGKKVATIVCGDFNSTPRGGVYEFLRQGTFDCMKLDRSVISGQKYGMYKLTDESSPLNYLGSIMNLNEQTILPQRWDDKDFRIMSKWYNEITNTHPILDIDADLNPVAFHILPGIDSQKIDSEAYDYCEKTIAHIKHILSLRPDAEEDLLSDPARAFYILKNNCGPFKSAYSEALLQYALLINTVKNSGKMNIEELDNYA